MESSGYEFWFSLSYDIFSNYLIQSITVMPSIMNGSLTGLEKMVSDYPNSIFYALIGAIFSIFIMIGVFCWIIGTVGGMIMISIIYSRN